ncbi:MAG: NUDIX domain-containing protein [Candidatus Sungbacteria bacterium]|nr:NUDIX domain-containing protein [Candidatus Sungbacteria bacterium]
MEHNYIDKLAWIYVKDGRILSTRSQGKDTWYIPGGKREGNETDAQALIREIKEELSIDIVPESISLFGTFEAQAHGKPEGTMVRMTCYTSDFTGDIQPAAEIEEYAWFGYEGKEKSSPVDKLIFDDLKMKGLIV